MSVNDQPPSADTTISQLASQPFASDLETLDRRLKRLSDDVLPLHPYLLTLPTNAPFRLGSHSANNWAVGDDRPFSTEEQQLQYMTFLTHHDTDSLLVAVGDWSDESGRMMADRSTAPGTTETPRETVAKKKISLKDYKSQKTTGTGTPSTIQDQPIRDELKLAKREEAQQAPRPDLSKKTDKNEPPFNSPQSHLHLSPEKGPKKRPSTSDLESRSSQVTKSSDMHSPKKPRLSPEKDPRTETVSVKSQSPRLPTLLSPTLPPTKLPPSPNLPASKLPRLLSPTLPPDLEKELAKFEEHSPARISPKRDITAVKLRRNDTTHPRTPPSTNSSSNSSFQISRTGISTKHSTPKKNLIVKLRYGKANRRRVEALLKFSGKRKACRSDSPPGQDTDHDNISHVERKGDTESARGYTVSDRMKPNTKHGPDEAGGHVGGRYKEPKGYPDNPLTPASHPLPPAHDKAKSTPLTPVKEPRGSIARRPDPGETGGKTPANPANKRHSVDPGTKGSPSQPDGRPRNNERRAWRDEFQKFSNIGRELKHAAERYTAKTGASTTDEKLAVVTAIEAILCFVLAFVADDQSKVLARQVGDSSAWVSILAYWRLVRKNSASYPILHSLCLLLGAVSYDAIHALDLERLAVSPLPGEHTPVPTPGSDGNTVLSNENKKSRKEFIELKNRLPECYRESQKLWLEGTRVLSEDVLSREFPTTWSRRSHNYAERGKTPLKAGDYGGDYFLPLGGTTPPIEVVRFGFSLLKEWCAEEDVEWKRRLTL